MQCIGAQNQSSERSGGGEKGRNNKWGGEEEEEALVFKTIMPQSVFATL